MDCSPQAPLFTRFSRQEYWSGLPCPFPGDLPGRQVLYHWVTREAQFCLIQFSHSVVSDSLRPHESQHTRPPCPSPTPGVYSNSCPSSRWCHQAISFSVVPFSSCPQSLPASGSFPTSQLFTRGGQSIEVSASAPVLPMNTQGWSPLGWTGWFCLIVGGRKALSEYM